MPRFTREFFAQTSQLHWVDDVVFIPKRPQPREVRLSQGYRKLIGDPSFLDEAGPTAAEIVKIVRRSPILSLIELGHRYQNEYIGRPWCYPGKHPEEREPAWIKLLDADTQAELRWGWLLGDQFDPLAIVSDLPCTGVGYAVSENGMLEKIMHALNLYRLSRIRQLAALHHPLNTTTRVDGRGIETNILPMFMGNEFQHTRWCHVLDVHALYTLIGCNVGLSPDELRHGRAAAFSHDGRTPALGDTTKWIDPEVFDEDKHYPDLLRESPEWPAVRDEFHLSNELLARIIMNEGLLGSILDIADKLGYIGRDVWNLIRYSGNYPYIHDYRQQDESVDRILTLGAENPYISSIWECVERDGDRVFFNNAYRLAAFLELRCWMFRGVYLNPRARFREHATSSILLKYLYETGQITAKYLLESDDGQLWFDLDRRFGINHFNMQMDNKRWLNVSRCASEQEAITREVELVASGQMVFAEKIPERINAGGHFLVRHQGRILPIAEALPKRFREIEAAARQPYPWYVYAFPLAQTQLNDEFRVAIDAYQRRRLAARQQGVAPGTP